MLEGPVMKEYLESKKGKKISVTRAGFPKEVYFEGKLKKVVGEVAVLEDENKKEIALPIDKILLVGPPEKSEQEKGRAGFHK
jgi:hypothetical protein